MKTKKSIIFAIFITATVFSAQTADSYTVRQNDSQSVVIQNNNAGKNTRSIITEKPKGNWSKIKNMFLK
ncbi:MAG: hypothetical protein LBH98_02820 [Chitinispirillales bacterium]|jgi:hypothetical protein|nr:hypothetical protein [Chitinispirillales bacterium]